jgi:hypothetical protein
MPRERFEPRQAVFGGNIRLFGRMSLIDGRVGLKVADL